MGSISLSFPNPDSSRMIPVGLGTIRERCKVGFGQDGQRRRVVKFLSCRRADRARSLPCSVSRSKRMVCRTSWLRFNFRRPGHGRHPNSGWRIRGCHPSQAICDCCSVGASLCGRRSSGRTTQHPLGIWSAVTDRRVRCIPCPYARSHYPRSGRCEIIRQAIWSQPSL